MKILFVSYTYWPPYFGGELLASIRRFESLVRRAHQAKVLTSGAPGFPTREEINGIEVHRSPTIHHSRMGRGLRQLLFPFWVIVKMLQFQFDILHLGSAGGINLVTSAIAKRVICQIADIKKVKTFAVHSLADTADDMFRLRDYPYRLRRFYLDKVDSIVSVSPGLNEAVTEYYPEKAAYLPYAVQEEIFQPLYKATRDQVRRDYGLDGHEVVFTFLGSVTRRKGFDVLAEAFNTVHHKLPNTRLWVIGPRNQAENQNIDEAETETLVMLLSSIQPAVRFFGRINDPKKIVELLGISDIFVFPTKREGMPISPLQAMSIGLPIIISKIVGVTDLANIEGETGYFVPPGDKEALVNAMTKLASNEELRIKLGKNARDRILHHFSWDQHVDAWEKLYAQVGVS